MISNGQHFELIPTFIDQTKCANLADYLTKFNLRDASVDLSKAILSGGWLNTNLDSWLQEIAQDSVNKIKIGPKLSSQYTTFLLYLERKK